MYVCTYVCIIEDVHVEQRELFINGTDQQEMLGGNLQEEGRENEGVTGGGNSPITANLKETGELSICSAHRRSREFKSLLSIMCVCVLTHTSKSRERPAHIGTYDSAHTEHYVAQLFFIFSFHCFSVYRVYTV